MRRKPKEARHHLQLRSATQPSVSVPNHDSGSRYLSRNSAVLLLFFVTVLLGGAGRIPLAATTPAQQADEPDQANEVIMLRNGGRLLGKVRDQGQQYSIELANGGELKLAYDEVDFRAGDLVTAYEVLSRRVTPGSYRQHLALGGWCVEQCLWDQAEQQLHFARLAGAPATELQSANSDLTIQRESQLRSLQRQLEQAAVAPSPTADSSQRPNQLGIEPEATPAPSVPTFEFDTELMLRFQQEIQPRLVHGCAASGCHGERATSPFQLETLGPGNRITRSMTERNATHLIEWIHLDDFLQSSLLIKSREPHADLPKAVYPPEYADHYRAIELWTKEVSEAILKFRNDNVETQQDDAAHGLASQPTPGQTVQPSANVARIPLPNEIRSGSWRHAESQQPGVQGEESAQFPPMAIGPYLEESGNLSSPNSAIRKVGYNDELTDEPTPETNTAGNPEPAFVPRDAFDPEIFNRYVRGLLNSGGSNTSEQGNARISGPLQFDPRPEEILPPQRSNSPASQPARNR